MSIKEAVNRNLECNNVQPNDCVAIDTLHAVFGRVKCKAVVNSVLPLSLIVTTIDYSNDKQVTLVIWQNDAELTDGKAEGEA